MGAAPVRVGVIGCGLIAQVMHLHYLRELRDRFEIAAICDVADEVRESCAREYDVPAAYADWHDLVAHDLDAVLVLTSGSHAPAAVAAAEAGKHVLVEKPMCISVREGASMIQAAERAGTVLMVAYNKRYDTAFQRLVTELPQMDDLRLARVTTLESPIPPYVKHYPLKRGQAVPPGLVGTLPPDSAERVRVALPEADDFLRWAYAAILLDTLVHEFNTIRGLLGEPDSLDFADIRATDVTLALRFGQTRCVISWVDLPVIARYLMEFAFYSPDRRYTLSFPSPFLRSMPTLLSIEGGEAGSPTAWRTEVVTSYESGFKRELEHFHECITTGRQPVTSGRDALRDIALSEAVVAVHRTRVPRERPTEVSLATAPA